VYQFEVQLSGDKSMLEMRMFEVSLQNGQAYIKQRKEGGLGGSGAFFAGAKSPREFSGHISIMIKDLKRVRREGMQILKDEIRKPLFPDR
jgi:hypothetical protein